ncbi:TetR/AcrR family transcriptional regulator [Nocardia sp. NPDC050406]|uniref:TetR/AcrR family transcriptional regulator n=1 Tax=Nocardia sp. NPDC050406 TaxID=3364318 RepID=UPI0037BD83BB
MTRTRMTAQERGEQVLQAAVSAFAESGYAATKTDEIARRAGVSQPYVIRLFGTKQQLFSAAVQRVCDRIDEVFREAAGRAAPGSSPEEILGEMGQGYNVFLTEQDLPLVLLHGFSASADPVIGDQVRDRFGRMYDLIGELSGAPVDQVRRFMSTGMLLTVMSAMRVFGPQPVDARWAAEMLDDLEKSDD